MLLGMMVVGASAVTYTDADDITNTQAVDVMSAIGVFQGTDSGDFQPNGDLTRETAAKIITYMLMGKTAADKLVTTSTSFKDVAATRWSAGSIAYCYNMGIIAGDGNGNFLPAKTVDGLSFAKMLLVALGYDASIEGFVGSDWAINVSKYAYNLELDNGMDVSLSSTLTREQACQMAFNALTVDLVAYSGGIDVKSADGTTVKVNATRSKVEGSYSTNYNDTASGDGVMQFCEQYFKKLTVTTTGADELGRPAEVWSFDSDKIGTYSKKATLTYTVSVKNSDMADYLEDYTLTSVTPKIDGSNTTAVTTTAGVAGLTGAGVKVEIYATNKVINGIYVTNQYLTQVSNIDSDKTGRYVTVDGNKFYTSMFAEDDYVVYTKGMKSGDTVIMTVDAAEIVTGTLTSFTGTSKAVVGGTTYDYNKPAASSVATIVSSIPLKSEVTLYLDTYGNVLDAELSKAASSNYAYVAAMESNYGDYSAKLLFSDGTTTIVQTDAKSNSLVKHLVSYVIDKDGKYSLTDKSDSLGTTATNISTSKGKVTMTLGTGSYTANAKTIYLIETEDGVTVYTGYANVPTITSTADNSFAVVKNTSGVAVVVYINVKAATVSDAETKSIYVVKDAGASVTTDENGTYYTYDAVVEGTVTKINVEATYAASISTGLYKQMTVNSKDVVTNLVPLTTGSAGTARMVSGAVLNARPAEGVITIDGNAYAYATTVKAFNIANDGKITASSSVTSLSTLNVSGVTLHLNDKDEVIAVYVTRSV